MIRNFHVQMLIKKTIEITSLRWFFRRLNLLWKRSFLSIKFDSILFQIFRCKKWEICKEKLLTWSNGKKGSFFKSRLDFKRFLVRRRLAVNELVQFARVRSVVKNSSKNYPSLKPTQTLSGKGLLGAYYDTHF